MTSPADRNIVHKKISISIACFPAINDQSLYLIQSNLPNSNVPNDSPNHQNKPQCPGYTLRTHQPGDMGWIIHRHAVLYEAEQGWGTKMEALVSQISHEFLNNYDASRERCWIAERNNEFLGCIVLMRDRKAVQTAKLRLLLVEPSARGLGLGRALIEQCTRFARETGYMRIRLWTQNVLVSARRLYAKEGYRRVSSEEHNAFGEAHVGECWELVLWIDIYCFRGVVGLIYLVCISMKMVFIIFILEKDERGQESRDCN